MPMTASQSSTLAPVRKPINRATSTTTTSEIMLAITEVRCRGCG
jgi:hypothetical protein